MTCIKQVDDIMRNIKYPPYEKNGDDDKFYHICLKYICKDFEKRYEIHKLGMMIDDRGGSNALDKCLEQLTTLTSKEVKKSDLTQKEQEEVIRLVKKTVSSIWRTI